jgi:hypothetical protein
MLVTKAHNFSSLGLLLNKAIDKTLQKQLVIYMCYLNDEGIGTLITQFAYDLELHWVHLNPMYGIVTKVINKMEWNFLCLVDVVINGASSMIKRNMVLTTCL